MNTELYILWDASTIWGLMALRAAQAFALPCRLVKATAIAQGLLSGKPPAMLLVPGGAARLKCAALGRAGREAIRQYVREGGQYLGFCGGAGLGLTAAREEDGLALCPWTRAAYGDRLQHLISGHALVETAQSPLTPAFGPCACTEQATQHTAPVQEAPSAPALASVPVWWPGRFAPQDGGDVQVLARYARPDADFWVADLPLSSVPHGTFAAWRDLYGVNLSADFLQGQPVIIHGSYGKGAYTLSYSHLETPHSPQANAWLAHLLAAQGGLRPQGNLVPPWHPDKEPVRWEDTALNAPLLAARAETLRLLETGAAHNLLFRRTCWLMGWRTGIPGAALNSLYAGLSTALSLPPTADARAYWAHCRPRFAEIFPLFRQGAEDYLLAERLATTLAPTMPEAVSKHGLNAQREALFGHAMTGGGLISELLETVDELIYRQEGARHAEGKRQG